MFLCIVTYAMLCYVVYFSPPFLIVLVEGELLLYINSFLSPLCCTVNDAFLAIVCCR